LNIDPNEEVEDEVFEEIEEEEVKEDIFEAEDDEDSHDEL